MSDRVPYAERPEIIERHCTCLWVHTQDPDNPDNPDGPARSRLHMTMPECPLHGSYRERSPF
jgi:hypothetical protein